MKAKPEPRAAVLRRRYARLAARLAKVGLLLQGTITERTIVRPDAAAPGKGTAYGPYYQWTRKHHGKTVTVNLTASQAKACQNAIHNHRTLEGLLRQMRALSWEILEATTISVKKRKPRTL
jgi:hypothetical protein